MKRPVGDCRNRPLQTVVAKRGLIQVWIFAALANGATPVAAFLQRQGVSEHSNLHDVGRLMIQQGLRPEEAMALPKKNIDLDARTLRVGKSKTKKGTGRLLKLTTESWRFWPGEYPVQAHGSFRVRAAWAVTSRN